MNQQDYRDRYWLRTVELRSPQRLNKWFDILPSSGEQRLRQSLKIKLPLRWQDRLETTHRQPAEQISLYFCIEILRKTNGIRQPLRPLLREIKDHIRGLILGDAEVIRRRIFLVTPLQAHGPIVRRFPFLGCRACLARAKEIPYRGYDRSFLVPCRTITIIVIIRVLSMIEHECGIGPFFLLQLGPSRILLIVGAQFPFPLRSVAPEEESVGGRVGRGRIVVLPAVPLRIRCLLLLVQAGPESERQYPGLNGLNPFLEPTLV